MRVLWLMSELPWPQDQGDRVRNAALLDAVQSVADVTLVVASVPSPAGTPFVPAAVDTVSLGLTRGQMVWNVARHPWLPVTVAARTSASLLRTIRVIELEKSPAVIVASQLRTVGLATSCRAPVVCDLTDGMVEVERHALTSASVMRRGKALIELPRTAAAERTLLARCAAIALASSAECDRYRAAFSGVTVRCIPNGTPFRGSVTDMSPSDDALLYVGNLYYAPNVEGLMWFCRQVLPRILSEVPSVRLDVVGKMGPHTRSLLERCPGIRCLGVVDSVEDRMDEASVAVAPLLYGGGTSLKVVQAMAAGLPVVATSMAVRGLGLVAGRDVLVADDPQSFAQCVVSLIGSRVLRATVGQAGLSAVAERPSWADVGREFAGLVEEVARKSQQGH